MYVWMRVGFCGCVSEKAKSGSTTSSQQSQSPKQGCEWTAVGDRFWIFTRQHSSIALFQDILLLMGQFTQLHKIKLHKTDFLCAQIVRYLWVFFFSFSSIWKKQNYWTKENLS